jgi:holo-[acyl-carrier protein] synthase
MIIGIGTDLLDIRRIEKMLERFGDKFVNRIFADVEQRSAERSYYRAASYAQRYAAKEACSKALGTGFRKGVFWLNLVINNLPSGKPVITVAGGAKEQLDALTPPGMIAQIDLSLTDEFPMANAVVVISATERKDWPPSRDNARG